MNNMENLEKLTEQEIDFIVRVGTARFQSKRDIGIPAIRSDGSKCSARNDIQATGAEYFAAKKLGCQFDSRILKTGGGGCDFVFRGLTVDAIWFGEVNGEPRKTGNLIINPDEKQRWSQVYVLVGGNMEDGYLILGCISHGRLIRMPKVDFGYGPKYAAHVTDLSPVSKLMEYQPS